MRHGGRSAALIVALSIMAGACASTGRTTLADRFVRQGTPSVDLGGPRPASMRPIDRNALLRTLKIASTPAVTTNSLESTDPGIAKALALVAGEPTSEHYMDLADAYVRRGVFDRAYDYLTRSLTVNGPTAAVYDSLARLWRDWGQPGEALGDAYRAAYLAPQSPVGYNTLGTILYRMGKTADARASFSRALQVDPTAWYALANLCHINMAAGDTRTAIDQCHKAAVLRRAAHRTN